MRRAILVTGASTGIGRAAVASAVRQGAHVYASVRREQDAQDLKGDFGAKVHPLLFDVTDVEAVDAAARFIAREQQGARLLGVVNNAGVSVPGPLIHMSVEELRTQFDVNLFGVHNVTRAFAPLLGAEGKNTLRQGAPGRFVMISSVGGKRAAPFIAAYASSKFALEGYSEGLRRELMPFGVDVVVIGPGAVRTAIWDKGLAIDVSRYEGSAYQPILKGFIDYVNATAKKGLPAEKLGELIWQALTIAKPKARYAITPNPLETFITRLLPTRALDKAMGQRLGLLPRP
jgi:hypothetical protein